MKVVSTFSGMSVNELATAKQFYSDLLGFTLADETMGLRYELPDGGELFLYEKPDHQPAGFTTLNLVVDDIDAAVDELTSKGVQFERYDNMPVLPDEKGILRGKGANMGPDIAWFKDPAGNILAVIEN